MRSGQNGKQVHADQVGESAGACFTPRPSGVGVSAVWATGPATGAAHSFFQFGEHTLDMLLSGFRLLDGDDPADPLIPREGRDVFPFFARRRIGKQSLPQIWRHTMHRPTRGRSLRHPTTPAQRPAVHIRDARV